MTTLSLFWFTALLGTFLFLPNLFFMAASSPSLEGGELSPGDSSDAAFKVASFHTLTGFFMLFGWGGLAASSQYGLSDFFSILIALAAGTMMVGLTALFSRLAAKLTSAGADFHISDAVGKKGMVYQTIPQGGRGVIQLPVAGLIRELDAVGEGEQEIPSFSTVTVLRAVNHRTVQVQLSD